MVGSVVGNRPTRNLLAAGQTAARSRDKDCLLGTVRVVRRMSFRTQKDRKGMRTSGVVLLIVNLKRIPVIGKRRLLQIREQPDQPRRFVPPRCFSGHISRNGVKDEPSWRDRIIHIVKIVNRYCHLSEIIPARGRPRSRPRLLHRRQQQRNEHRNNRNRHQQLYQREAVFIGMMHHQRPGFDQKDGKQTMQVCCTISAFAKQKQAFCALSLNYNRQKPEIQSIVARGQHIRTTSCEVLNPDDHHCTLA